ncbi:MAG: hypothetical protein MI746_05660 [Pseudomonadales bacterium]|nr:hypothetical protein [Pseudomonadales bacterium]
MAESDPKLATELTRKDRFVFGFLLPIATLVPVLFLIMMMDSNSGAAEFAALGIFLIVLTISPILLIVMVIVAFQPAQSKGSCYKRGMIAPGIVILGAFLFQLGLWDALV